MMHTQFLKRALRWEGKFCYLICTCSARVRVDDDGGCCSDCGATYDASGWILEPGRPRHQWNKSA